MQHSDNREDLAKALASDSILEPLVAITCDALDAQCRAAYREIHQTRTLLADASRRLLDTFHAATRELEALEPALGHIDQSGDAKLHAARATQNLLAASQGLQFPDLVGQLLVAAEHRVDGLLRVIEEMHALVQALEAARADPSIGVEAINRQKHALREMLSDLDGELSHVRQSDMHAGELDLF